MSVVAQVSCARQDCSHCPSSKSGNGQQQTCSRYLFQATANLVLYHVAFFPQCIELDHQPSDFCLNRRFPFTNSYAFAGQFNQLLSSFQSKSPTTPPSKFLAQSFDRDFGHYLRVRIFQKEFPAAHTHKVCKYLIQLGKYSVDCLTKLINQPSFKISTSCSLPYQISQLCVFPSRQSTLKEFSLRYQPRDHSGIL